MKIVILDGKGINPGDLTWDCFEKFGQVDVYDKTPTKEETVARLQGATVAVTNKTPIDGEILDACPIVSGLYFISFCLPSRDRLSTRS